VALRTTKLPHVHAIAPAALASFVVDEYQRYAPTATSAYVELTMVNPLGFPASITWFVDLQKPGGQS
jgi:hypothetical protein